MPLMFLHPIFHGIEVGARIRHLRIALQGLLVRRDGLFVLALFRQRVAEVVARACIVALRESLGSAGVVTRTVIGGTTYAGRRREFLGLRGITVLQRLQRALI